MPVSVSGPALIGRRPTRPRRPRPDRRPPTMRASVGIGAAFVLMESCRYARQSQYRGRFCADGKPPTMRASVSIGAAFVLMEKSGRHPLKNRSQGPLKRVKPAGPVALPAAAASFASNMTWPSTGFNLFYAARRTG
ncbi:hypothetical protein COCOBI_05-6680 [Coccomyxa sp. Obi]|nr:hypothetical protein COCOBI_05-6680 [Coccomyxa sp. Obi]